MSNPQHQKNCDRIKECGKVISEIGEILKGCQDTAEARRVLVAAGLAHGVFDVSDDYRIFCPQKNIEYDENVPRPFESFKKEGTA